MKKEILKLREEGKSYNEIKSILGCSKSTISYYCNPNQKEKVLVRNRKRRENILLKKSENFKNSKHRNFVEGVRKYQKRDNKIKGKINKNINCSFTWKDVIDKFGVNTKCYLSGEKLNLFENVYSLDHILPVSKGGDNSFNNLGILHKDVNSMKHNMSVDELLKWCKKILEFNGYTVIKKYE